MEIKINKELDKMCFKFLNELRDSGQVNMFGAVPYLIAEFELDRKDAREIFTRWTKTFEK